jgi:hypothetical protein
MAAKSTVKQTAITIAMIFGTPKPLAEELGVLALGVFVVESPAADECVVEAVVVTVLKMPDTNDVAKMLLVDVLGVSSAQERLASPMLGHSPAGGRHCVCRSLCLNRGNLLVRVHDTLGIGIARVSEWTAFIAALGQCAVESSRLEGCVRICSGILQSDVAWYRHNEIAIPATRTAEKSRICCEDVAGRS